MTVAADNYTTLVTGLSSPAGYFEAVTPSDTSELTNVSRALYIGGAGNLVAVLAGGYFTKYDTPTDSRIKYGSGNDDYIVYSPDVSVTFVGLQAGTILPIRCRRVNNTNTTATYIVNLY